MKTWLATYTHTVDDCWSVSAIGNTEEEAKANLLAKLNSDPSETFTAEEYEEDGDFEVEELPLGNSFWEVGFGYDSFTRFCLADTEEEAKAKFISMTKKVLDNAEEPGWEENVWAVESSDRWMP